MPELELLALRAPDGATVTLERFPILLGRTVAGGSVPDVDVSHLDLGRAVENRHCELLPDVGGVLVRDLGAAGGTWVDGRRLPPGGRALLRVGETMSVAGVLLSLVSAPGRRSEDATQLEPDDEPLGGGGEWHEPGLGMGVPPPPSARDRATSPLPPTPPVIALPPSPAAAPPRSGLDLTAAPVLARAHLEQGADSVQLTCGFPLMARRQGSWSSKQGPLTEGDLDDAVRTVRRALDLGEETSSGWGYLGDLAVDFGVPPLVERAFVGAVVATAGPIPEQMLAPIEEMVAEGGCLLVAMRRPDLALREIAERLRGVSRRPRVLSWHQPVGWVPPGWPVLECGSELGLAEALTGDPLVVINPPGPILETILAALPRPLGGTVLALEAASVEAALEECARRVLTDLGTSLAAGEGLRNALGRRLGLVLTSSDRSWRLLRASGDGGRERWALEQLASAEWE
jgi:hypothetical protein